MRVKNGYTWLNVLKEVQPTSQKYAANFIRTAMVKIKTVAICSAMPVKICGLLCETEKSKIPHLISRSISMNERVNLRWSIIFCTRSRFYLLNNINQRNELSNSMCSCIRLQHKAIHRFPVVEAIDASCLM